MKKQIYIWAAAALVLLSVYWEALITNAADAPEVHASTISTLNALAIESVATTLPVPTTAFFNSYLFVQSTNLYHVAIENTLLLLTITLGATLVYVCMRTVMLPLITGYLSLHKQRIVVH